MAEKNILKNLKSYLEDPEISQEEKNLFIDVVSFKKLMQSPLVKLIAIERTNQILEDNNTEEPYKEESENEIMIKFDNNKLNLKIRFIQVDIFPNKFLINKFALSLYFC